MIKNLVKRLFYSCANDLSIVYGTHFIVHRRLPALKHQRSFSDRMAFRRLFPQPAFGPLSDKVQVRDYVRDRVGEAFLIPIYGFTSHIDDFPFEDLPTSFDSDRAYFGSLTLQLELKAG